MKSAKKLLVAVLTLALLCSAFALSVFADGPKTEAEYFEGIMGIDSVEDILEYFTHDDYLSDNYNDIEYSFENWRDNVWPDTHSANGTYIKKNKVNKVETVMTIMSVLDPRVDGDVEKVLSMSLPYNSTAGYKKEALTASGTTDKNAEWTRKLFLTFEVCFDESCEGNMYFELKVGTKGSASQAAVLTFDFTPMKNGKDPVVTFVKWNNASGMYSSTKITLDAFCEHVDEDKDNVCDNCSKDPLCVHTDADLDYVCDKCTAELERPCEHADEDGDGVCDNCEYVFPCEHVDGDGDGICNICAEPVPCEHIDEDENGVCDVCENEIVCEHVDANSDYECDNCGEELERPCSHTDNEKDNICDACGEQIAEYTSNYWYDSTTGETIDSISGFTPKTGTWYDVTISYNADEKVSYFEIKEDESDIVFRNTQLVPDAQGIWGFECYSQFKSNTTIPTADRATAQALVYLNDMAIYEGSYTRYQTYKTQITEQTLAALKEFYQAASREDRYRIADVIRVLYGQDEDGNEMLTDDLKAIFPEAIACMNETYANEFILRVADIDTDKCYYDRFAYTEVLDKYNSVLPDVVTGLPGITEELEATFTAAREALATEVATLGVIKSQSQAFVEYIGAYDDENKDYHYIVNTYDAASNAETYGKRDALYEGVAEAEAILSALKDKKESMVADVENFIGFVTELKAAIPDTFGKTYSAYNAALLAYNKYNTPAMINPALDNSTNEDLTESIAYYESIVAEIEKEAAECDKFIDEVLGARSATYYTTIKIEIEDAKDAYAAAAYGKDAVTDADFEYVMDYPEFADSLAAYNEIVASIAVMEENSANYIAAVNALDSVEGFYEKMEAVNAALELKKTGDNIGIDGVADANLKLTQFKSVLDLMEGNSKAFIKLVGELKSADGLSERRALIFRISEYIDGATEEYNGVTEAIADFENEVAEFNADVEAINSVLQNATVVSGAISGAVKA